MILKKLKMYKNNLYYILLILLCSSLIGISQNLYKSNKFQIRFIANNIKLENILISDIKCKETIINSYQTELICKDDTPVCLNNLPIHFTNYELNFCDSCRVDVDKFVKYEYIGYIKEIDCDVIKVEKWENEFYLTVNCFSNKIDTLLSMPIFSPNKKNFFTYHATLYDADENIIEIYGVNRFQQFKKILIINIQDMPIEGLAGCWLNNNKILLSCKVWNLNNTINYLIKFTYQ